MPPIVQTDEKKTAASQASNETGKPTGPSLANDLFSFSSLEKRDEGAAPQPRARRLDCVRTAAVVIPTLLAVPLLAILKITSDHVESLMPLSRMLEG